MHLQFSMTPEMLTIRINSSLEYSSFALPFLICCWEGIFLQSPSGAFYSEDNLFLGQIISDKKHPLPSSSC